MLKESRITYDEQAKVGYIYLTSLKRGEVLTTDLEERNDILLDTDTEGKLLGIEFLYPASKSLVHWKNCKDIFQKYEINGRIFYQILFDTNKKINFKKIAKEQKVAFLFADQEYLDLVGIEIDVN